MSMGDRRCLYLHLKLPKFCTHLRRCLGKPYILADEIPIVSVATPTFRRYHVRCKYLLVPFDQIATTTTVFSPSLINFRRLCNAAL